MMTYEALYRQWQSDPKSFWLEQSRSISWYREPSSALDESNPPYYRWFKGGELNTCYNCVDRHVEAGRGKQDAIIYDSPATGVKARYSYDELLAEVSQLAGVLSALGVEKGDRVIIYMPMVPQALFAMLACARIGAIHSVVFGGFAANELKVRIDDAKPKVVLTATCGIEVKRVVEYMPLVREAMAEAEHQPNHVVVFAREQAKVELSGRELDWQQQLSQAQPAACVALRSEDPLYILYTSGTTGKPKGVLRDNGGHATALYWSMKHIYNIDAGDVYWAASDVGWVVGHSYIVYGPLLKGCTTIVYEGKPVATPDAGAFWRVIEEYKVKVLFTAPTAFRAIKKEDPQAKLLKNYNTQTLDALFLAGERSDPDTLNWATQHLKVPIIDHWWQTETGWAIASNFLGVEMLPVKAGSPTRAVPGYEVEVLDDDGKNVIAGEMGNIVIRLPMPPSALMTVWGDDERYLSSYLNTFDGYYLTGDAGYIDEDGYIWIMSRTDDILNVAGHRLSTGVMEEAIANHPDVAECAVVGVNDALKGQIPVGLLVLKAGAGRLERDVVAETIQLVRDQVGAVAAFKTAMVVGRLPKTRSGKVLRATMRAIANGDTWTMPATIDDPSILEEIETHFKRVLE